MADSHVEAYLKKLNGDDADITFEPQSNVELYLASMNGMDVELPEEPGSRVEALLADLAESGGGGGSSPNIEPLTVTENGEYDAGEMYLDGFNPVLVNVPNSYSAEDEGLVVYDGGLVVQEENVDITENGPFDTTNISSVNVNVHDGPRVYTISGTGGELVTMPAGIIGFMGQLDGVPIVASAVTITMGSNMLTAGCVGQEGALEFAYIVNGNTVAYGLFEHRGQNDLALTRIVYDGQDMSAMIPLASWTITVFINFD